MMISIERRKPVSDGDDSETRTQAVEGFQGGTVGAGG
jgi:hypothetical protein